MRLRRLSVVMIMAAALSACGGHGFEGEFTSKTGSDNEFADAFASMAGSQTLTIGADYIEANGQRHEYDEIFVRESGKEKYLIFKDDKEEESWKIEDKDTLVQSNGFINVKLVRVK